MAGFPRDEKTAWIPRDPDGRILVDLSGVTEYDPDVTADFQAGQGILRGADGAILLRVTGLPGSAVTRTGGTISDDPDTDGLVLTAPDYTDTMRRLLRLTDGPENLGRLLQIDHRGQPVGDSQNYAVEVHNHVGANTPVVVHQYSGAAPALWIDNTDSAPTVKLKLAENSTLNPGKHGTGDFLELDGYFVAGTSYSDGVVTGTTTLTSASATFTAEDVGKPIVVGAISTTIATRVSATQVTLAAPATNGSGVTWSYAPAAGKMLTIDHAMNVRNSSTMPLAISSTIGDKEALKVGQLAGATKSAMQVTNPGSGSGLVVTQSADAANGAIRVDLASSATSTYGILVNGQRYGIRATTTQDNANAVTLLATKSSSGAGTVARLQNSGTGLTLDVQSGTTSVWAVTKAGLPQWIAASNVQTTVGTAGPAAAPPATPSKYLKVVGDDGTTYVIPAYAAA